MSLETHLLMIHSSIIQTTQICKYISWNEFYFLVSIKSLLFFWVAFIIINNCMTTTTKSSTTIRRRRSPPITKRSSSRSKQSKCLQGTDSLYACSLIPDSRHVLWFMWCNAMRWISILLLWWPKKCFLPPPSLLARRCFKLYGDIFYSSFLSTASMMMMIMSTPNVFYWPFRRYKNHLISQKDEFTLLAPEVAGGKFQLLFVFP